MSCEKCRCVPEMMPFEYMAICAMQGILAGIGQYRAASPEEVAAEAYRVADAMWNEQMRREAENE